MKRRFLVNYDYGMGGAWAFLMAESEEQIAARFAELTMVHDRPPWLTDAEARRLEETLTLDIDDHSAPILRRCSTGEGEPLDPGLLWAREKEPEHGRVWIQSTERNRHGQGSLRD